MTRIGTEGRFNGHFPVPGHSMPGIDISNGHHALTYRQPLQTEGFSKLDIEQRFHRLVQSGVLSPSQAQQLRNGGLISMEVADSMIENVIGRFEMPMGVAVGVRVNGVERVIPMCVEETSIIAAVSKTSKWIRERGEATAEVLGNEITGHIHFPRVRNITEFEQRIAEYAPRLIAEANERIVPSMVARGGGVTEVKTYRVKHPNGGDMAVVEIALNACDAMGANIITQICERLRPPIEDIVGEKANMSIVCNLSDRRLIESTVMIDGVEHDVAHGIEDASIFAEEFTPRAVTHNKGIMNGIDPILIATGNDWRAVSAGAHAFAAKDGKYRSLSTWRVVDEDGERARLVGKMTIPMAVGTVGGATRIHPTAQLSLQIMDVHSADCLLYTSRCV